MGMRGLGQELVMQNDTASVLINNLMYFPGWSFSAVESNRFEDSILVRVSYPSHNTNKESIVDNSYTEEIAIYGDFVIMVGDLQTTEELYRRFFDEAIMKIYEHEAREALREKSSLYSPFHPHKIQGMNNWIETNNSNELSKARFKDLMFGTA